MEVRILEKSKTKAVFELAGSNHTICNALKKSLHEDKEVKVASYTIEHPLIGIPKFILQTSTKSSPQKALASAARRLQKENAKFLESFKAVKP